MTNQKASLQDTLVLAAVITVCSLFLLIYWWRK